MTNPQSIGFVTEAATAAAARVAAEREEARVAAARLLRFSYVILQLLSVICYTNSGKCY